MFKQVLIQNRRIRGLQWNDFDDFFLVLNALQVLTIELRLGRCRIVARSQTNRLRLLISRIALGILYVFNWYYFLFDNSWWLQVLSQGWRSFVRLIGGFLFLGFVVVFKIELEGLVHFVFQLSAKEHCLTEAVIFIVCIDMA